MADLRNESAHGAPFDGLPQAGLLELVRDLIDYAYRDWPLHPNFAHELASNINSVCPGRVEDGRGGLAVWLAPFPIPAHQTGRAGFPHPAFRLVSLSGTRR